MLVLVTIVVIAYFYYRVTAFLEPDWRALYSAPGHGPYTHLTRPLLAFFARGDWLARLNCYYTNIAWLQVMDHAR